MPTVDYNVLYEDERKAKCKNRRPVYYESWPVDTENPVVGKMPSHWHREERLYIEERKSKSLDYWHSLIKGDISLKPVRFTRCKGLNGIYVPF